MNPRLYRTLIRPSGPPSPEWRRNTDQKPRTSANGLGPPPSGRGTGEWARDRFDSQSSAGGWLLTSEDSLLLTRLRNLSRKLAPRISQISVLQAAARRMPYGDVGQTRTLQDLVGMVCRLEAQHPDAPRFQNSKYALKCRLGSCELSTGRARRCRVQVLHHEIVERYCLSERRSSLGGNRVAGDARTRVTNTREREVPTHDSIHPLLHILLERRVFLTALPLIRRFSQDKDPVVWKFVILTLPEVHLRPLRPRPPATAKCRP